MHAACSSALGYGLRWLCGAWVAAVVAWAVPLSSRTLEVQHEEIAGPEVAAGAGVSLARAGDGSIGLAWVDGAAREGAGAGAARLYFSNWDQAQSRWGAAVGVAEIAQDGSLNAEVCPVLAMGGAGAVAVAFPQADGWRVWRSSDGGLTWSAPSRIVEGAAALAMAVLADGRPLAVWRNGSGEMFAQVVGTSEPPQLVTCRVVALAEFSLVPLLDGSASLAVWVCDAAGNSGVEVHGFDGEKWRAPSWMVKDRPGAPNSASVSLVADGPQLGAIWTEGAETMCSSSSDGGLSWTLAQQCNSDVSAGAGAIARLRDGSLYAVWNERMGPQSSGLFLRRYNALGGAMQPALLGWSVGRSRAQIVALREDSPAGPAQLLVVRVEEAGRVVSHVVVLPKAAALAEMDADCDCLKGKVVAHGYAVKGRVLSVEAGPTPRLRIWQHGVFGLIRPGELTVRVESRSAERLRTDQAFLARLEQRAGEWWLLDVRLLGAR